MNVVVETVNTAASYTADPGFMDQPWVGYSDWVFFYQSLQVNAGRVPSMCIYIYIYIFFFFPVLRNLVYKYSKLCTSSYL
jgi:hypothetical protein